MKKSCNIKTINPKDLTQEHFIRLNEVTQDMWANGIWEFVQCENCNKMMSKQDIFWHLEKEIYYETTSKIIKILWIKEINCVNCSWKTNFVYWDNNIDNIKSRLLQSKDSFIVLCENDAWEIIWYMDWYVESPEVIFKRELYSHYSEVWFEEINKRVIKILWHNPNEMISFSSMWLLPNYSNFFTIFAIYKAFSEVVPMDYLLTPWITELDKNNNLYFIYKNMLGKSLDIKSCGNLKKKIKNTWENYDSDIVVFNHPSKNFKEKFSLWIREFLRSVKN